MQHIINRRRSFVAGGVLLFSSIVYSGTIPPVMQFEEGEQLNLSLSHINFNRVFVEGEKITKLRYPTGTFVVDKSELNNSDAGDGSIYLKPVFDAPITVFFSTDKGHHFSITIKSDESSGKTLRLAVKNQTQLKYVKRDTPNSFETDAVIAAMKEGIIPKYFKSVRIIPQPFYVKKDIRVTLEKQYQGKGLSGYVYRIENTSRNDLALSTSLFSHKKAEALSLSQDTLAPKQVAYLYGLYHNEA
jgi:conjugal transfer pilus assembly protein TraK